MINHISRFIMMLAAALMSTLPFAVQNSYSQPIGGEVAAGSAVITNPNTQTTHIQQNSDKAIINWQSYNVGVQGRVVYRQPSSSSIVLNRINPSQGPSRIYGQISANGQVWLQNGAGIWFGPTAHVNVAGLLATTASISNADFLAGRYYFEQQPGLHGSVINEGHITVARAGLVALIGEGVVNRGLIEANLGTVVLAAGSAFTVNFTGNELISFTVDREVMAPADDQNGNKLKAAVTNNGRIIANGGKIMMSAHTASDILDHTISMKGIAQAKSVAMKNGELILDGGDGLVEVSGKLIASGNKSQQTGGKVQITGKVVALADNAVIDVSGDMGGGTVLIGGNAHGLGPLPNSDFTFMGSNAVIKADALTAGNGGTVVLWSDKGTQFYGNIFARGGSLSGNGGWIETSGKEYLAAAGAVSANAINGTAGSWLLDPANVIISNAATSNGTFDGGSPNQYTTTANTAVANVTTIINSLNAGTSVTILTTPGGTQAGTITLSNAITKTLGGAATLTLDAASNIVLNADISSTSDKLNVILQSGGAITVGNTVASTITTNDGDFTATAVNDFIMSNAAGTILGTINTGAGKVAIAANTDGAGAQAFTMRGGSSITTTSTASDAVSISVNSAGGGTGTAALRDINTGNGGGVIVTTATGGNVTGSDITMVAGTDIDVGTGTVTLTTPQIAGANIGVAGTPINMVAGTLNATTGTSGIFINNTGTSAFNLTGVNTTGAFSLTSLSSTGITDSGNVIATGTTTLLAGATQDITLDNAGNDFATLVVTSGNNVTINDATAIILGANIISGTFNLTTAGAITQSAAQTITGTATLNAGVANNITLATSTNDFSTVAVTAANNVSIRDANTLDLGASTIGGTLLITASGAGGSVTQSGALSVSGVTTLVTSTTNNITLNNANNDFSTVAVTSGNNVSLIDTNSLILGTSTITGTYNVTTNGALTQSGTVSAANALTTLASGSANDITLLTAANNFNTVTVTSGNNVSLRDTNAIVLSTVNVNSSFSVTAGAAITQTGAGLTAPTLTMKTLNNAGGAITLTGSGNEANTIDLRTRNSGDTVNAAGVINYIDSTGFDIAAAASTSTITLTGGNAITQSGAIAATTLTVKTLNNSGAAITLNNTANAATTINLQARNLTDTADAAGAISYIDTNSIAIAAIDTTSSFSLTAGTAITQTGVITVGGATTITANLSPTDISLASFANDFALAPTFTTTGPGVIRDISLRNVSATATYPTLPTGMRNLSLIFNNSGIVVPTLSLTGTLSLTAGGAITQSGAVVVTGTTTIDAGANDVTLNNSGNNFSTIVTTAGNNVAYTDSNALILGATNVTGTFDVTSGALTDSGNITVAGVATFNSGASAITLNSGGNNFNQVAIVSSSGVTLVDISGMVIGPSAVNGAYTLTAAGAITQSGALSATTATIAAGALNDITLNNAANDLTTIVITSGNNVVLVDSNALNLGTTNASGNLTVTAGGAVTDSGNIVVNGAGGLTVTGVGGVVLNSGSNQIANLNVTNSGSGAITINSIVSMSINGFSQSGGGATTFTNNTGTLSIANGVTLLTNDAALSITAADLNLNLTGAIDTGTATTSITQNTAGNSIALGNAVGNMNISGSELQRISAGNLIITDSTNGQIIVDGISTANSSNISNLVTLNATTGNNGSINFQTGASSFRALSANADDGITVGIGAGITTTVGNMALNGDAGGGIGGNDSLSLSDNLTSAGSMSLSATNGGIILAAPVSLTGNGITLSSAVDGAFNLTVDSGAGNTVFSSTVGATTPIGSGIGVSINLLSTGLTTFSNTVDANSGISSVGSVTFNNAVTLADGSTGSTFGGRVTLGGAATHTFSGFDGLNFNGGLSTAGGAKTINSNGSDMVLGQSAGNTVILGAGLILNSTGGDVSINGTTTGNQSLEIYANAGNAYVQQINTNNDLTVVANNLFGTVNLSGLSIGLNTGNFFGTVDGSAGEAAIKQFILLSPVAPGTVFFNGIDITLPPPPPPPPTPGGYISPGIIFPTNYTFADLTALESYLLISLDFTYGRQFDENCVSYGPMIKLCGNWD